MVVALLLIIAGLLFCFTGIGAVIGVPFILLGFVWMLGTGFRRARWLPAKGVAVERPGVLASFGRVILAIAMVIALIAIAAHYQ